jgi:hypothetical protein
MVRNFSEYAMQRPRRSMRAAEVLRNNAWAIKLAAADAREDEIVVAVVRDDLTFGGAWTIAREDMIRQIPALEGKDGWSFTFSSQTPLEEIERRCYEYTRLTNRRWELMQRWSSRHQ